MDTPTTANAQVTSSGKTVNLTVQKSAHTTMPIVELTEQRTQIFRCQEQAVQRFYADYQSGAYTGAILGGDTDSLFYLTQRQSQFVETRKLKIAYNLNARDTAGLDQLQVLFNHLHVVDDLLLAVTSRMPAQRPVGWQMVSLGQNLLNLPTTTPFRIAGEARGVEQSLASTILQFFGVACYSVDKGYFIGHVLGYLFCCYYFAHLGIGYGVTPLKESIAKDYPYQSVNVPELVRLLQQTDETLKAQVYQLAIYAAQISEYAIDKRIEKMLITEVNSFNKQDLRDELAQYVQYSDDEISALFQPLKPLK